MCVLLNSDQRYEETRVYVWILWMLPGFVEVYYGCEDVFHIDDAVFIDVAVGHVARITLVTHEV